MVSHAHHRKRSGIKRCLGYFCQNKIKMNCLSNTHCIMIQIELLFLLWFINASSIRKMSLFEHSSHKAQKNNNCYQKDKDNGQICTPPIHCLLTYLIRMFSWQTHVTPSIRLTPPKRRFHTSLTVLYSISLFPKHEGQDQVFAKGKLSSIYVFTYAISSLVPDSIGHKHTYMVSSPSTSVMEEMHPP